MFKDYDVISVYSRTQAIEDGVLIDVSSTAKKLGFKYPVALTNSVWVEYVKWHEKDSELQGHQDEIARLHDILWMLYLAIKFSKGKDIVFFKLSVIPRDGKSRTSKTVTLKAVVNGGDDGVPVITIMRPDED